MRANPARVTNLILANFHLNGATRHVGQLCFHRAYTTESIRPRRGNLATLDTMKKSIGWTTPIAMDIGSVSAQSETQS